MIKVKVTYQTMEPNENGNQMQVIKTDEVECESFNLSEAVSVMNGIETDAHGNRLAGFMVGDKNYYRALEVVKIEIV